MNQLQAEQRAFERFAERVATMPRRESSLDNAACYALVSGHATVVHSDVSGDSLINSLIAELGADVATVLTDRTTFIPPLQTTVCGAASQDDAERAVFLNLLTTERTALKEAAAILHEIETQCYGCAYHHCLSGPPRNRVGRRTIR